MLSIAISALIYTLLMISCQLFYKRRISLISVPLVFAVLVIISTLSIANFELSIFAQKFASQFSFDWYLGRESPLDNSTFAIPAIFNSLAFAITQSWSAAIGVNVAIVVSVFYFVYTRNRRLAYFALAPSIVNFSMFALRDPLIYLCFFIYTYLILKCGRSLLYIATIGFVGISLGLRPENIVIILGAFVLSYYFEISSKVVRVGFLFLALSTLVLVTPLIPRLLGLDISISIVDFYGAIDSFYISRATRWVGEDGGGSNILGGALVDLPLYLRYPIQVVSFFLLPLPWEVTSLSMALAFCDSLVFVYLSWRFHLRASFKAKALFWIYVLAFAFFMSNYGNALRMRMPVYGVLIAGLLRSEHNRS